MAHLFLSENIFITFNICLVLFSHFYTRVCVHVDMCTYMFIDIVNLWGSEDQVQEPALSVLKVLGYRTEVVRLDGEHLY